jgi:hypothetical protein
VAAHALRVRWLSAHAVAGRVAHAGGAAPRRAARRKRRRRCPSPGSAPQRAQKGPAQHTRAQPRLKTTQRASAASERARERTKPVVRSLVSQLARPLLRSCAMGCCQSTAWTADQLPDLTGKARPGDAAFLQLCLWSRLDASAHAARAPHLTRCRAAHWRLPRRRRW